MVKLEVCLLVIDDIVSRFIEVYATEGGEAASDTAVKCHVFGVLGRNSKR